MSDIFTQLINDVRQCTLCQESLPHGVNPVIQMSPSSKIIIAGQAPGLKVHQSGTLFDDKSGERLRLWLGVDTDTFYNDKVFAILPMAFCYPGKGKSGDLAPRPECAKTWREQILEQLTQVELIIAIGHYAQQWHLPENQEKTLTETVKSWQNYYHKTIPAVIPIPHPSPRNNIWLKKNPWFESDVVPSLQAQVQKYV